MCRHVCTNACMYVCVCMYACMHACMRQCVTLTHVQFPLCCTLLVALHSTRMACLSPSSDLYILTYKPRWHTCHFIYVVYLHSPRMACLSTCLLCSPPRHGLRILFSTQTLSGNIVCVCECVCECVCACVTLCVFVLHILVPAQKEVSLHLGVSFPGLLTRCKMQNGPSTVWCKMDRLRCDAKWTVYGVMQNGPSTVW
jgi:hypothetical protein